MSSTQDLEGLERRGSDDGKDKKDGGRGDDGKDTNVNRDGDAEMKDAEPEEEILDEETLSLGTEDLKTRKRLLENDARIMKSEFQRLSHEKATMGEKIKENNEKIANNRFVIPSHYIILFYSILFCSILSHHIPRYLVIPPLTLFVDNYLTSLATLLNCSTLILLPNRPKRVPILI